MIKEILEDFFNKFPLQYVDTLTLPPSQFFKEYLWLRGYKIVPIVDNK